MIIRGNKTPVFTLGGTDYASELRSIKQVEGDEELTTFAQRASGQRPVAYTIELDLDFGTGKLYNYLVANAGLTNVAYVHKWAVGGTSVTNPQYSGTLTIPAIPLVELEQSAEKGSLEVTFQCDTFNVAFA